MPVVVVAAAAVVAVAAVDNEDGVQWWRWQGHSMAVAAFDGRLTVTAIDGDGVLLKQGNGKAKMATDTSGGGWRWWASVFDSGNGRSWVLVFDGGNGQQLWQQWTIETAFNGSGGGGV